MNPRVTLNSVEKALRLLELVSSQKTGYTLTELMRRLRISMGSAQRITNTLVKERYLEKDPQTKIFRLTPKFFLFGSAFLNQLEIREIALPHLRRLNEALDEIVNLGIMINDQEMVYIDRIDKTSHILTTNLRVGTRRPLHLNSIGKVILAFLPEKDQKRILDSLSRQPGTSSFPLPKIPLPDQLRRIRKVGYCANRSELFDDLFAIAVPILNHQNQPVAGINVVMPRQRIPEAQIRGKYIPLLIKTGKDISYDLGNLPAMDS